MSSRCCGSGAEAGGRTSLLRCSSSNTEMLCSLLSSSTVKSSFFKVSTGLLFLSRTVTLRITRFVVVVNVATVDGSCCCGCCCWVCGVWASSVQQQRMARGLMLEAQPHVDL